MTNGDKATRLYVHTLESLLDELTSGRAIALDDTGSVFQLTAADSRAALDWYRVNRSKWAQRNRKEDVEALVDHLKKRPPELPPPTSAAPTGKKRILHLASMRLHRFGGVHRYGAPERPPEDLEFAFEKSVTLIHGKNGAGKSSLLSAIVWCLTGHVYRAQRLPETVETPVVIRAGETDDSEDAEVRQYDICAITPLPPREVLDSLGDEPVPLDTAVELSFVDDSGAQVGSVTRAVKWTSRGKVEITEPDFSSLALEPMAREVGTRMPGLIPYIQLGVSSDLGMAVSSLTGIKPLEDVVQHASKSKSKLEGDLVRDRKGEIASLDGEFTDKRRELEQLIDEHPEIGPGEPVPLPSSDRSVEETLGKLAKHFDAQQAMTLRDAQSILGDAFDPRDKDTQQDLFENLGAAIVFLDAGNLRRLPSAARLHELGALDDEQLAHADSLIQDLASQAGELAALSSKPDLASRLRLYTRVASWLRDRPGGPSGVKECPVCLSDLKGKMDPVSGRPVAKHIEECLAANKEYLERTLNVWEQGAIQFLRSSLPGPLQAELDRDLPREPADLISHALAQEVFEPTVFKKSLAPLKEAARSRCSASRECLPRFAEPRIPDLPHDFSDGVGSLRLAIRRASRGIAVAQWRKAAGAGCKEFHDRVIGERAAEAALSGVPVEEWPLMDRLSALDRMVKSATPLREALEKVKTLKRKLSERRNIEERIALYGEAAKAIKPLLGLKDLVQKQVAFLMSRLSNSTKQWRDRLYIPAFRDAPEVTKTDVDTNGSLAFEAQAGGTIAPADHVSNASDLRATLLSFLLAFWEYLLEQRGGLSLLLLDDLQELFDPHNRRRVANTVPAMVAPNRRVVITTNDDRFGESIAQACNRKLGPGCVDRRTIHPRKASRDHLELGHFQEEVNRKRDAFLDRENKNEDQPARDYINYLRMYLENRLLDLLDDPEPSLPAKPTLSDLLSAVRRRVNAGHDAFASQPFRNLVFEPALANGSDFLELMNKSHHGREHEIVFHEVWRLRDTCARVKKHVEAVHEEYERYMRRDPREPIVAKPACPMASPLPHFDAPVLEDLAAFTSSGGPTETVLTEERLSDELLAGHAIYVIKTHNFGFAGQHNCRAIVRLSETAIRDNSLVIALHKDKVYARRLLQSESSPGMIALGSEAENPENRPRSIFLPAGEVRLLPVVGVLFEDGAHLPRSSDEAVLASDCDLLGEVQVVFRVRGDSALPLALPRQLVLGRESLTPDQLGRMQGCPVALATTEGAAFKRIGGAVPGMQHVRLFDGVGALGTSMLVRTEDVEGGLPDLPLLLSVRRVLGVLYEAE